MPTFRSSAERTSERRSTGGSSSRGSRPGFRSSETMSRRVGTPVSSSLAAFSSPKAESRWGRSESRLFRRSSEEYPQSFRKTLGRPVAFRVNGGVIQHFSAFRHPQESCALLKGFGPQFGHFFQLRPAFEGAVFFSVGHYIFGKPPGKDRRPFPEGWGRRCSDPRPRSLRSPPPRRRGLRSTVSGACRAGIAPRRWLWDRFLPVRPEDPADGGLWKRRCAGSDQNWGNSFAARGLAL